jgi:gluconate 2-dehydrogenase gamma chain
MAKGSRRQFIRRTVLGFGGYLAVSAAACKPSKEPEKPAEPGGKSLNAGQLATLTAACERILPRDEDPGATDLGCAVYIDRMLADPDARSLFGRALIGGLAALDYQSHARYGRAFAAATPEEQDLLLASWQRSKQSGEKAFFEVLHSLTLEGAFGDPSYGGNLGGRGFALVGFTPPEPRPGHLMQLGH